MNRLAVVAHCRATEVNEMKQAYSSITARTVQTEILIGSLSRLDQAGKEAVARVLMASTKVLPRLGRAIETAIRAQLAEQKALDGWADEEEKRWFEYEIEKHENRYALEK